MHSSSAVAQESGSLTKREAFLGMALVMCAGSLGQIIASPTQIGPWHAFKGEVFQWIAWASIFVNLASSEGAIRATRRDQAVAVSLALLSLVPSTLVWAVESLAAFYLLFSLGQTPKARAAGVVLLALAGQKMWGPLLFWVFTPEIVKLDSVATALSFLFDAEGVQRSGGVLSRPDGHAIEILAGCSSFHNVSLSLLCWVAVLKLERPEFFRADWLVGLTAAGATVALNLVRLHEMAVSGPGYEYWHVGPGFQIFRYGTTFLILGITYIGTWLVTPRNA